MRRSIAAIFVLSILAGCQSSPPGPSPSGTPLPAGMPSPTPATPTPSTTPTADSDNTVRLRKTTIKTKQGQKWEMEAEEVDWADGHSEAQARAVTWWLLDKNDKKWVKVESPRADVDMDNEIVTFQGRTVATRIGFPESLKVEKLVYKGKEKKFYGSGGVIWQRAGVELSGETLTATAQLDKVQLKGGVRGSSKGGFGDFEDPRETE